MMAIMADNNGYLSLLKLAHYICQLHIPAKRYTPLLYELAEKVR